MDSVFHLLCYICFIVWISICAFDFPHKSPYTHSKNFTWSFALLQQLKSNLNMNYFENVNLKKNISKIKILHLEEKSDFQETSYSKWCYYHFNVTGILVWCV